MSKDVSMKRTWGRKPGVSARAAEPRTGDAAYGYGEHEGPLKHAALRNGMKRDMKALLIELRGQVVAAEATRVSQQTLSDYANITKRLMHVPVDVLLDLMVELKAQSEGEAPYPYLVGILARELGYDLVHRADGGSAASTMHALADMTAEFSSLAGAVTQSLADDGHISAIEIIEYGMVEQVQQVIRAATSLERALIEATEGREQALAKPSVRGRSK